MEEWLIVVGVGFTENGLDRPRDGSIIRGADAVTQWLNPVPRFRPSGPRIVECDSRASQGPEPLTVCPDGIVKVTLDVDRYHRRSSLKRRHHPRHHDTKSLA